MAESDPQPSTQAEPQDPQDLTTAEYSVVDGLLKGVAEELLTRSGTGIAVVDGDLRFLAVNRMAAEINGIEPEEHLGLSVAEVVPEVARELEPVLRQVLRSGAPITGLEVQGAVPQEAERPRIWSVSIAPAPGRPDRLTIVFTDVTAQRAADHRLRKVLDSLFGFVGLLDRAGRVLEASSAALASGGMDLDAIQGRAVWDIPLWSWNAGVSARMREATERALEGESSRYDELIQLSGGRLVPIDLQLAPLKEGERVVGMVLSALDISERVEQTTRLESLAHFSGVLAGCTTTSEVLEAAVAHPSTVENATALALVVLREGDMLCRATGSKNHEIVVTTDSAGLAPELELAIACARSGTELEPADPAKSTLNALPLHTGDGRLVGAVALLWTDPQTLDPPARARLSLVSDLLAQAIIRAAKVDELDELVAEVGRHALETHVDHPDVDIAVRYRPSADTAQLGGDWFDIVELDSGRLAVSLGDVAGHGPSAAGRMAHVRGVMHGLMMTTPPEDLFDLATQGLAGDRPEMIATAVVAVIDMDGRELHTVLAGHPPPLMRDASGAIRRLETSLRPPIGIPATGDQERGEALLRTPFTGDSTLVIYSDGLVERRFRTVDDGLAALERAFSGLSPDLDADSSADAILEELGVTETEDDLALIVVKFRPAPHSTELDAITHEYAAD